MQFTTYSENYLKGLKKDDLIALYRQLENNLKSEISENEIMVTITREMNLRIAKEHKENIIKARKEAVEEFSDTLIYKLDNLKPIRVNLGYDTTALTFRKEALLNLISDVKKEQNLKTDKPLTNSNITLTNSDIIRSLLKRYN